MVSDYKIIVDKKENVSILTHSPNGMFLFYYHLVYRNHTIFRLDTHLNLTYLCAVTFNNNDYGKRKSKLPGGI